MEDSPNEAIKNNAIGTYKTAYAAMVHGCERFVLISIDKAVNQISIMGASKHLCEMIIRHGENYLCDICKEHPRFYNGFDDHTEAGIGLVCEEACRLVLNHDGAFELIGDDGSKMELPGYVKNIYDCAKPINERLKDISGGAPGAERDRDHPRSGVP